MPAQVQTLTMENQVSKLTLNLLHMHAVVQHLHSPGPGVPRQRAFGGIPLEL